MSSRSSRPRYTISSLCLQSERLASCCWRLPERSQRPPPPELRRGVRPGGEAAGPRTRRRHHRETKTQLCLNIAHPSVGVANPRPLYGLAQPSLLYGDMLLPLLSIVVLCFIGHSTGTCPSLRVTEACKCFNATGQPFRYRLLCNGQSTPLTIAEAAELAREENVAGNFTELYVTLSPQLSPSSPRISALFPLAVISMVLQIRAL